MEKKWTCACIHQVFIYFCAKKFSEINVRIHKRMYFSLPCHMTQIHIYVNFSTSILRLLIFSHSYDCFCMNFHSRILKRNLFLTLKLCYVYVKLDVGEICLRIIFLYILWDFLDVERTFSTSQITNFLKRDYEEGKLMKLRSQNCCTTSVLNCLRDVNIR